MADSDFVHTSVVLGMQVEVGEIICQMNVGTGVWVP